MADAPEVERAIREALQAQIPEVYFWDPSDEDLFKEGEREWSDFRAKDGSLFKLADRFDLRRVAEAAITALTRQANDERND